MLTIEDEIAKASALSAGLRLGMYEEIDLFRLPEPWLIIADGVQCCINLVADDLNANNILD